LTDRRQSERERRAAAEDLAIAALGFIAAEPERLSRFLALTGIDPASIRAAAREPQFLVGVLDHILNEERLLLDFATESDVDPEAVMRARDALAGPHWERNTP
jgi:uncharacterized protein DUF3572